VASTLIRERKGSRRPRTVQVRPLLVMASWPVIAFALFQLRWSDLYGAVTWAGLSFLAIVVVAFGYFGLTLSSGTSAEPGRPTTLGPSLVIAGYFLAAFAANGGVPLLMILRGQPYDIYSFGLPFLHVGMLAFSGFYGTRLFADFIKTGSRAALLQYMLILFWLVLIASRSAASFLIFSSVIIVLFLKRMTVGRFVAVAAALMAFVAGFGIFGSARLGFQISQSTGQSAANDAILDYAQASSEFLATGIPASFMWFYLYLSSPVANLMSAVTHADVAVCGRTCDLGGLLTYTLVPDVVGVRVAEQLGYQRFDKEAFLVQRDLTASTTFGSAIGYAGLVGALSVMVLLLAVSIYCMHRFDGSDIREVGLALLCTVLFFSFFENMIAYSALSLQLAIAMVVARPKRDRRPAMVVRRSAVGARLS